MTGFAFASVGCPGPGVAEETAAAFATVEGQLQSLGLELADIVRTRLLYTARSDYPAMGRVREPLFRRTFGDGAFPAAAGFATGGRGGTSPRFELEVVACRPKTVRNSPSVISSFGGVQPPFAHANEAHGVIFVSGQTAFELDGSFPDRTPQEQARKVLDTVAPIVAEFGSTIQDVIALTVFVDAGVSDAAYREVRTAIAEFVGAVGLHPPVVTCVTVTELVFPGALVGMEAVAVAPGTRTRHATGICQLTAAGEFFAASSASTDGQTGDSAFIEAAYGLDDALGDSGVTPRSGSLVTVWYAGDDRDAAEMSARRTLETRLPDAHISIVPLQPRASAPAVIFEIYGACNPRRTQEAL